MRELNPYILFHTVSVYVLFLPFHWAVMPHTPANVLTESAFPHTWSGQMSFHLLKKADSVDLHVCVCECERMLIHILGAIWGQILPWHSFSWLLCTLIVELELLSQALKHKNHLKRESVWDSWSMRTWTISAYVLMSGCWQMWWLKTTVIEIRDHCLFMV